MSAVPSWLPYVAALLLALAPAHGAGDPRSARVGAPGLLERESILDGVRERLGVASDFAVEHLAVTVPDGAYAFVRATQLVPVAEPDGERQETDLAVMALLELPRGGAERRWRVVELWTLPGESALSRHEFVRRVRARQAAAQLPAQLFPAGL